MTWHVSYRGQRADILTRVQKETCVPPRVRTLMQLVLDSPLPPGRKDDPVYLVCSGSGYVCGKDNTWGLTTLNLLLNDHVPIA